MIRTRRRRIVFTALSWGIVASVLSLAGLFLYSWLTFREITELMEQEAVSQPTLIYSDLFVVKKGGSFTETFLKERLKSVHTTYQEKLDGSRYELQWIAPGFSYPNALIETIDKNATLPNAGDSIQIIADADQISEIRVAGVEVSSVVIEPDLIAQLAGSNRSIRDYVKLDDIPTVLKEAIISVEDMRFRDHFGFDLRSLARALWIDLKNRNLSQGGSTITQQLVKNLMKAHKKTLSRKTRELILALFIEARYEKERILEKYLNEVYFGQIGSLEVHGVSEAAKYFFGKPLSHLTIAEMALIAGVIRGPTVYSPYKHLNRSLIRKDVVLKKLWEQHYIAQSEYESAKSETLHFSSVRQGRNEAPYYVDYVKSELTRELKDRISEDEIGTQGFRIFTFLDMTLQRRADAAVSKTIKDLEARFKVKRPQRLEGLLVSANSKLGTLLAIVGGHNYEETTFNRVLNMKRPVGSTFKPIAYLAALLKGKDSQGINVTPSYLVEDAPFTYEYEGQKWTPRNYDKTYRGKVTLRDAFAQSLNIPMAKIGTDAGLNRIIEVASKLGISSKLQPVPSLVLGAFDVGAVELLQVYSTFANRGVLIPLTTLNAVFDKDGNALYQRPARPLQVFDTPVIDLLNSLLRSVTLEGTAKALPKLGYSKPSYGKTGTTNFYRDSWFAGFSEGISTVTWIGFDTVDQKSQEQNKIPLTGAAAALPLWAQFYSAAKVSKLPSEEAPLDSSIEKVNIDRTRNCKSTGATPQAHKLDEFYLPGTSPAYCEGE